MGHVCLPSRSRPLVHLHRPLPYHTIPAQCLPSDIVPIRSWTRTLRPPGIRHRHLPYHTIPCARTARHTGTIPYAIPCVWYGRVWYGDVYAAACVGSPCNWWRMQTLPHACTCMCVSTHAAIGAIRRSSFVSHVLTRIVPPAVRRTLTPRRRLLQHVRAVNAGPVCAGNRRTGHLSITRRLYSRIPPDAAIKGAEACWMAKGSGFSCHCSIQTSARLLFVLRVACCVFSIRMQLPSGCCGIWFVAIAAPAVPLYLRRASAGGPACLCIQSSFNFWRRKPTEAPACTLKVM